MATETLPTSSRGRAGTSEPSLVHPDAYADLGYPHEFWKRLRREDPVHWFDRTEGPPFWAIITRVAAVKWSSTVPPPSGIRSIVSGR